MNSAAYVSAQCCGIDSTLCVLRDLDRVSDAATSGQLIEAAHDLSPMVRSYADRIEAERRLPPELVAALRDAGLFRMTVPRSLGGSETTVPAFREIMETIARADAST